jgi:hypothetical protein
MQTKLLQFDEFFSINHEFSVNVTKLEKTALPTFEQFIQQIPMPFKMASEVSTIDQAALRPLQGLHGAASQLVDYLHYQSQKIEMLVSYILSQQDDKETRFKGVLFGGGGIIFCSAAAFELGDFIELKIFIADARCSIFCIAEIIEITAAQNDDTNHHYKVIFHYIREEDREILVRTSLHEQAKQLQALAKKRQQEIS